MRTALAGIGFVSVLISPVVAIAFAITLSVRWRAWEALVIGILLDILWVPAMTSYALPMATIGALVLVWSLEPLRREFL